MNKILTHKWQLLSYLLLALVLLFNFLSYFNHNIISSSMEHLNNSDAMYLPTLYDDLFRQGGSYKNWYLTPAPYFFPDMPLYFVASFVGGQFYYANFIFFNLQLIILFVTCLKINRLFNQNQQLALLNSCSFLGILYLLPVGLVTILLMLSGHHFGVMLSGVIFLYLVMKILQNDKNTVTDKVLLGLLIALIVASDKLFVVQFLLPAVLSLCVLWLINNLSLKKLLWLFLLIIGSTILGLLLYQLVVINPTAYEVHYNVANISANLQKLTHRIISNFSSNYLFFAMNIVFHLAALFFFCWQLKLRNLKYSTAYQFFIVFVIICSAVLFSVLSLSTLAMANRYLIPFYFLPIIFFPLVFYPLLEKYQKAAQVMSQAILLGVLLLATTKITNQLRNFNFHTEYYPKHMQCFDDFIERTGAKHGIAYYWLSKSTTMMSKNQVSVAAVTPDLYDYPWITTAKWFKDKYDFVLVSHNPNDKQDQPKIELVDQFSHRHADKIINCQKFDIYYYPHGLYTKPKS